MTSPMTTAPTNEMLALADELADDIVSMAQERDSTCELKYDASEATERAKRMIVDRLAATPARDDANGWRSDMENAPLEDPTRPGCMFEIMVAGGTYYDSMSTFRDALPFEGWTLACWDRSNKEWRGENSGGHDEFYYHRPTHWRLKLAPPNALSNLDAAAPASGGDAWPPVSRCEITGNPVGTDTRPEGQPCLCLACCASRAAPPLQAPAHSDAVREAFEEWAARDSRDLTPLQLEERAEDNGLYYECSSTNDAYIGWREASKHSALAPAANASPVSEAVRPTLGDICEKLIEEHKDQKPPEAIQKLINQWHEDRAPPLSGPAVSEADVGRYRHKKRGSTYTEVGRGKIQSEYWRDPNVDGDYDTQAVDMREVVVYRADSDGSIWVRPVEEFDDGRFAFIQSAAQGGGTEVDLINRRNAEYLGSSDGGVESRHASVQRDFDQSFSSKASGGCDQGAGVAPGPSDPPSQEASAPPIAGGR